MGNNKPTSIKRSYLRVASHRLVSAFYRTLPLWLSAGLAWASPVQASSDLHVGDKAPNFTLTDQNDTPVTLSQFQGQWLVLYFYPKNDTPGCTQEACSFRDNINRIIAKNAVILGVSVDSVSSHQDFRKKYRLPFSLLADTDGKVARQYGALLDLLVVKYAKRHSFIIDPQGRIAKIYRDVEPETHVKEVLTDLTRLQHTYPALQPNETH